MGFVFVYDTASKSLARRFIMGGWWSSGGGFGSAGFGCLGSGELGMDGGVPGSEVVSGHGHEDDCRLAGMGFWILYWFMGFAMHQL